MAPPEQEGHFPAADAYAGAMKTLLISSVLALSLVACRTEAPTASQPTGTATETPTENPAPYQSGLTEAWKEFKKPSEEELRAKLTEMQFRVTQEEGTERSFNNEFWDNHADGLYVDILSGEPLFSSRDKFESGTGWPSFVRPVSEEFLARDYDTKLGYQRTEVRSAFADSHLGHVFEDGPEPTGLRYCINSAALRFIPVAELESAGLKQFLPLFEGAESTDH